MNTYKTTYLTLSIWLMITSLFICSFIFGQTSTDVVKVKHTNGTPVTEASKSSTISNSKMTVYRSTMILTPTEKDKYVVEFEFKKITNYSIKNLKGETMISGYINDPKFTVDISDYTPGVYYLILDDRPDEIIQLIKD